VELVDERSLCVEIDERTHLGVPTDQRVIRGQQIIGDRLLVVDVGLHFD
jgi:hypothetical protein